MPHPDSNPDKVPEFWWPYGVGIGDPDNNPDKVSGFDLGHFGEVTFATTIITR